MHSTVVIDEDRGQQLLFFAENYIIVSTSTHSLTVMLGGIQSWKSRPLRHQGTTPFA